MDRYIPPSERNKTLTSKSKKKFKCNVLNALNNKIKAHIEYNNHLNSTLKLFGSTGKPSQKSPLNKSQKAHHTINCHKCISTSLRPTSSSQTYPTIGETTPQSKSSQKSHSKPKSPYRTKIAVSIAVTTKLQPQQTHQTIPNPTYITSSLQSKSSSKIYSSKISKIFPTNLQYKQLHSNTVDNNVYSLSHLDMTPKLSLGGNDNADENINGNALVLPTLQLYSMDEKACKTSGDTILASAATSKAISNKNDANKAPVTISASTKLNENDSEDPNAPILAATLTHDLATTNKLNQIGKKLPNPTNNSNNNSKYGVSITSSQQQANNKTFYDKDASSTASTKHSKIIHKTKFNQKKIPQKRTYHKITNSNNTNVTSATQHSNLTHTETKSNNTNITPATQRSDENINGNTLLLLTLQLYSSIVHFLSFFSSKPFCYDNFYNFYTINL